MNTAQSSAPDSGVPAHTPPVDATLRAGDRVRSYVSVMGRPQPMHLGVVVRNYGDGSCDVDRMSLHGGAPWIVREATSTLRLESSDSADNAAAIARATARNPSDSNERA